MRLLGGIAGGPRQRPSPPSTPAPTHPPITPRVPRACHRRTTHEAEAVSQGARLLGDQSSELGGLVAVEAQPAARNPVHNNTGINRPQLHRLQEWPIRRRRRGDRRQARAVAAPPACRDAPLLHPGCCHSAVAIPPSRPPANPATPPQRHQEWVYPPRRHLNSCASTRSSNSTRMTIPAGLFMSIPDFLGILRAMATGRTSGKVRVNTAAGGARALVVPTGSATQGTRGRVSREVAEREGWWDEKTRKKGRAGVGEEFQVCARDEDPSTTTGQVKVGARRARETPLALSADTRNP